MEQNGKLRAEALKEKLHNNDDIILREISLPLFCGVLMFLDEIVDTKEINASIIKPLIEFCDKIEGEVDKETLLTKLGVVCEIEASKTEKDIAEKLFKGFAVLFVDDVESAICFNVAKFNNRAIMEPPTSMVIKGPREGFTENIKINLGLIRKRLITDDLKIESFVVGEKTQTQVKLVYLVSVADDKVVKKIREKINLLTVDGIVDSYYMKKILEDRPNSIFKQIGDTEKPDICCAKILEGRVAIFVDGSPIVLTIPFLLMEDLQSSNDYYSEAHRATMLRILRLFAAIGTILLPGFYIAMQLFHYKVLPLKFLITIVNTTQNLPLNPLLEILFIMVLFEILFEASIRMPKYLGVAISIVGALILGDTAVKAGLVSPPGVMIVAISAITVYTIPDQSTQVSLLRIIFAFIGGILGFQGLILAGMFMVAYLAKLDSFGTPYLAPCAPFVFSDQKDFLIKEVFTEMQRQPKGFPNKGGIRQKYVNNEKGGKEE